MKTRLMIQVEILGLQRLNVTRGHFFGFTTYFYSFLCLQGSANQYNGFIDCAQTILREEGAGAFLKVKAFAVEQQESADNYDEKWQTLHCAYLLFPLAAVSYIWRKQYIGWTANLNMQFNILGGVQFDWYLSFCWQGIQPRVLWIGIGGSIFFGVLEKTKSVLAERSSRRDAKPSI